MWQKYLLFKESEEKIGRSDEILSGLCATHNWSFFVLPQNSTIYISATLKVTEKCWQTTKYHSSTYPKDVVDIFRKSWKLSPLLIVNIFHQRVPPYTPDTRAKFPMCFKKKILWKKLLLGKQIHCSPSGLILILIFCYPSLCLAGWGQMSIG